MLVLGELVFELVPNFLRPKLRHPKFRPFLIFPISGTTGGLDMLLLAVPSLWRCAHLLGQAYPTRDCRFYCRKAPSHTAPFPGVCLPNHHSFLEKARHSGAATGRCTTLRTACAPLRRHSLSPSPQQQGRRSLQHKTMAKAGGQPTHTGALGLGSRGQSRRAGGLPSRALRTGRSAQCQRVPEVMSPRMFDPQSPVLPRTDCGSSCPRVQTVWRCRPR